MAKLSLFICLSLIGAALLRVSSAAGDAAAAAAFFELKKGDFSVKVTNQGASLVSVVVPDRCGVLADVVLGLETPEEYENNRRNFGALVGRDANRIKGAEFTLNGQVYKLNANTGNNTIHGGLHGFGNVTWNLQKYATSSNHPYVIFSYTSVDGDQGFPGEVRATVKFMLIDDYTLSTTVKAEVFIKATPVNIAQHTYWNLRGHDSGSILDAVLQIDASNIVQLDTGLLPTGLIESVKGTPNDFLKPHKVGDHIQELPIKGYDTNFVLDKYSRNELKRIAIVYDNVSGRLMEIQANQPVVQLFTANTFKDVKGKNGSIYQRYAGMSLGTQWYPDALHHRNFPSVVVNPGQTYHHRMQFKFSTDTQKCT